jgi:hypothetical protein
MVPEAMTFDQFISKILYEKLRLVVDGSSAQKAGLVTALDSGSFGRNLSALEGHLRELGLLKSYSDATKMVGNY